MVVLEQLAGFFGNVALLAMNPMNLFVLFGAVIMGIIFGAIPGLTSTLGVALLTTLTFGMTLEMALLALLGVYVGGTYGASYSAILLNIPGSAAAAATAFDGYPLALKGKGGETLGLATTASAIGTFIGMLFVVSMAPAIARLALRFTSVEFFLLALFGIIISGTLTSEDLAYKGWIAGLLGILLALVGRDPLQSYPRFTFGIAGLGAGIEVVPVLIGAFGIPQIIQVLKDRYEPVKSVTIQRIVPGFGTMLRNAKYIVRSSLIGVGIGAVPGIGEDIAGWVSYGVAKNSSPHPEEYGKGSQEAVICTETANNSCIGGAMIPLLSLGIPGSPPSAVLLGALLLHGVNPGPMLRIDRPEFILQVTAIMLLASFAMWIAGMLLAKQVVKVLRIPPMSFMPIIGALMVIGSYALNAKVFNLYLMLPVGIVAYFLTEMKYPIAPLVIGVILGGMADESLRRALMVSGGSFMPFVTRPVALALLTVTILAILSQFQSWKSVTRSLKRRLSNRFLKRDDT